MNKLWTSFEINKFFLDKWLHAVDFAVIFCKAFINGGFRISVNSTR